MELSIKPNPIKGTVEFVKWRTSCSRVGGCTEEILGRTATATPAAACDVHRRGTDRRQMKFRMLFLYLITKMKWHRWLIHQGVGGRDEGETETLLRSNHTVLLV